MDKPETVAECEVAPAVENVFVIEEYKVPAVVEYLHVAFSLVVSESVAWVVPAGRGPTGEPLDLTGGAVSVLDFVVAEAATDWPETLPAAS